MDNYPVYEAALSLKRAGYTFMPAGIGKYLTDWNRFRDNPITADQIECYFGGDAGYGTDIDVFCNVGPVFLQTLDFDNHTGKHAHVFPEWRAKISDSLLARLSMFRTKTEGSYRVCWHCEAEPSLYNDEVAVVLHKGKPRPIVECLTHCKVPGGHTTAYQYLEGSQRLEELQCITREEQEHLIDVAMEFHEYDAPTMPVSNAHKSMMAELYGDWDIPSDRPGDDFNRRAEWADILEPHGWEWRGQRGEMTYWRRPGSHSREHHATTDYKGNGLLHVFSASISGLEKDRSYTKFFVYAMLNHCGDFSKAGKELARRGYGG